MKSKSTFIAAVTVCASLQLTSAAEITGKIILKGTPPPEKNIDGLKNDPTCGKSYTEMPTTHFYLVGKGGELADTFVYIKAGAKPTDAPATAVTLDQVGCQYQPYVFGLQTKQKLLVKNSDPVLHNIHVTPKAAGNKESNQAQMAKGPDLNKSFDASEIFLTFKCDVHPWMFAYACVVDHPYYAVSGKDGTFKIANLPPGKYTIEAAHRKAGAVSKEITVTGDNQTVNFEIELKPAQ
ncbi:MAG: hypothetical protein HY043_20670 [Verrucomicrobia bacterium]|nr:hypothetical protein [Verrucomicrobiota bacterium]